MPGYNGKVYRAQGGDELVVDTGGKITAAGTQAAAVADPTDLASALTAIIALRDALKGVGIIAAS